MTDPVEVQRIFDVASTLEGDERAAWLDEHCTDPAIRDKVEQLLAHYDKPPSAFGHAVVAHWVEGIGAAPKTIGRYELVKKVGEGAMGVVHLAECDGNRVALKLMHARIDSEHLRRRFIRETQVLARLEHPGIARFLDAGVATIESSDGRESRLPYMAMEYVEGDSLTRHAKRAELSDRERIELLARVADALEHAHARGIIHRDLKPSNILVATPDEGIGRPKVLDFGVARAVEATDLQTLTETKTGALVGTIAYMSPEQVAGDGRAVDERSDVYSLGVLLFELLAGRLPYPVTGRPLPVAARVILEDEPTRLGSIVEHLRGDVELVVATALEKDANRRYSTAADFARDLRRHLAGEPIFAKPATWRHQALKFSRRHKVLVGSVAAAVVALTIGLIGTLTFALRESEAKDEARRTAYRGLIAAATAMLKSNDVAAARSYLEETDADLRGWEWGYLVAQLDESAARIVFDAPEDLDRGCKLAYGNDQRSIWTYARGLSENGHVRGWSLDTLDAIRAFAVADGGSLDPGGEAFVALEQGRLSVRSLPDGESVFASTVLPAESQVDAYTTASPFRVLASVGQEILLWNDAAAPPLTFRSDDERRLHFPTLHPSGQRVAGSFEGGFAVLELRAGARPWQFEGAGWGGRSATWSGTSGKWLAWPSSDGVVHVFDTSQPGPPVQRLEISGHFSAVEALAFSADERWLATAGNDRTVRIWEIPSGRLETTFVGPTAEVLAVAFAADGEQLATLSGNTVHLWDIGSADPHVLTEGSYLYALAFTPGGARILVGAQGGRVRIYDADSSAHVGDVRLASATSFAEDIVCHPTAGWAAIATTDEGSVRIVDLATGGTTRMLEEVVAAEPPADPNAARMHSLWVSPDGRSLYGQAANGVVVWDVSDWSLRARTETAPLRATTNTLAGDPLGRWIAVPFMEGGVQLLRAETLEPVATRHFPTDAFCSAFRPDGGELVCGASDGTIRSFELPSMLATGAVEAHSLAVYSLEYSPDGARLISGGQDSVVRVWDVASKTEVAAFQEHKGYVYTAILDPDGERLISTGGDGTVRVWDASSRSERLAAGARYEEVVDRLEAQVTDSLKGAGARESLERLRTDTNLTPREREIALQLLLGASLASD